MFGQSLLIGLNHCISIVTMTKTVVRHTTTNDVIGRELNLVTPWVNNHRNHYSEVIVIRSDTATEIEIINTSETQPRPRAPHDDGRDIRGIWEGTWVPR